MTQTKTMMTWVPFGRKSELLRAAKACALLVLGLEGAAKAQPKPESAPAVPALTAETVTAWLAKPGPGPKCTPKAMRIVERTAYVACGLEGFWVLLFRPNLQPEVERRDLGGDVIDLFERGGQLWAEIARAVEARPVVALPGESGSVVPVEPPAVPVPAPVAPEPAPAPAPPPNPVAAAPEQPPAKKRRHGTVVAVEADMAVIDFGAGDELLPGTRIEILVRDAESIDPKHESYSPIAVGKVISVTEARARVRFGLNERIPVGARARVTKRSVTAGQIPPRLNHVWELWAQLGPMITMDEAGAGVFAEAHAIYRFDGAAMGFVLSPFAFALAGDGSISTLTGFGFVSLDSTSFELGVGIGGQTVNSPDYGLDPGSGTTIPEFIRLGARDGVHFQFRTDVVLFHQEFSFAAANAQLQFNVADKSWLVARVGGGPTGYVFGELALRSLLRGNGDVGSSFLSVGAGWLSVYEGCELPDFPIESPTCDEIGYEGPLVRVGLERRY